MATKLTVSALFVLLLVSPSLAFDISITPEVIRQGDVILIRAASSDGRTPEGSFLDKELHFFKTGAGDFIALAGVDMRTTPGEYCLTLSQSKKIFERNIKIVSGSFETQKLSLPKKMVDLDPETLKRAEAELSRLIQLWPAVNERLWDGRFIMPLQGAIISPFGARRIINGQEKSPHSGIDIKAKEGDPVIAPNSGRVAIIDDQFFGGKTLVLDHGYGIYSMFFHLSKITLSPGQTVKKGDIIGLAGATGRATGPHLHWGVR
ncbi:MAG: M23 family metallopeptidase, partial [Nitrospirae bacterium]|nr:M23 family metallopeptidase [Nitrospirota bacterium]